jgi:hypothetical protein
LRIKRQNVSGRLTAWRHRRGSRRYLAHGGNNIMK